jgi:chromosome segregation ATPase
VASTLAVLALVGGVTAILLLATEPRAARLQSEIASLNSRLGTAHTQLIAVQNVVGRTISERSGLTRNLRRLDVRVAGLERTVHGLQSSTILTQEQATGLRECIPQLQQELAGLSLTNRSVNGRVTSVKLSDQTGLSPSCQSVLSVL